MRTCEWVFSIAAVIKVHTIPIQRAVAASAIFGKAAFMRIILGMASDASGRGTLKCFGLMASFASHRNMLPHKRELRQAVIKFHVLPPAQRAMTILASVTKLRFVNVLRLVTADARHVEF